jgi:hypothetical protein
MNVVYNIVCNREQKWFTIMYVGKERTFLAKLFELNLSKIKPNKFLEHTLRIYTMEINISQVVYTN